MILLDGKQTSAKIKEEIATQVSAMKQQNKRTPHLAAVLVGTNGGRYDLRRCQSKSLSTGWI